MNRLYYLLLAMLTSISIATAQGRRITGLVLAEQDAQPLIGASVYVHSDELQRVAARVKALGVVTNLDGKFTLEVPQGVRQIRCSYIGYKEQVINLSAGQTDYTIKLSEDAKQLGELVVTGYQTIQRAKLPAAITRLELSEAVLGANKRIDQALAGQIAGVSVTNTSGSPGAPARIRIRGTASLNGTQDPLWVLDGIPLEGTDIPRLSGSNDNEIANIQQSSIAGFSPNDIESITILKDAAATAIYGARAANGVIVITTKRGKRGKPVVNFSSRMSYAPRLSEARLNLLDAKQKVDLELALLKEQPFELFGEIIPHYAKKGGVYSILERNKALDAYRTGSYDALSPAVRAEIEALSATNTDWSNILFRDALTQEYNVSISGGTDRLTYYNSLGYTSEEGNVAGVGLERFNLSSKINYNITQKFRLGLSLFANRRQSRSFVSDKYGLINPVFYSRIANPYFSPYNQAGGYNYDYDVASGNERDEKRGFNIFEERAGTSRREQTTGLTSLLTADYRPLDGLKLSTQLGVQWEQLTGAEFVGFKTFTMRDLYEGSSYRDPNDRNKTLYLLPQGARQRDNNRQSLQLTWKAQAEYSKHFGDAHELQAMAGSELRKNSHSGLLSTAYGFDPKTLTTKPIHYRDAADADRYPVYAKNFVENAFASFYSNASYTLLGRYTLGASLRMDGSDLFGVDEQYRYLPIYSVSGLWNLSREAWLRNVKAVDNLALRASYGLQGNVDKNTSPYLVGSYVNVNLLPGSTEQGIRIDAAPNDKLRWEKTASYNVGLDASLFGQALNFSLDYYHRRGTDLIGSRLLPLENGFSSQTVNWAQLKNEGIELNMQTRNIVSKNFSWYSNFNLAYNSNKVLRELQEERAQMPGREGYPVGAIFALPTSGVDPESGRILLRREDGTTATFEQLYKMADESGFGFYAVGNDITPKVERGFYQYMGTSDAPWTGGLNNSFTYKNWEFNVNLSFFLGAKVRTAPSYSITDFDLGRNVNSDILSRWTTDNKAGTMPALVTRTNAPADFSLLSSRSELYRNLDIWVRPLNYVRLQNLRLAYRLPESVLRTLRLSSATVALEGQNLMVFGSSYRNYLDPESQSNLYATPLPKTVTFNLNLSF